MSIPLFVLFKYISVLVRCISQMLCVCLTVSVSVPVSFSVQLIHRKLRQNVSRHQRRLTDQQDIQRSSGVKAVAVLSTVVTNIHQWSSDTASQHRL